MFGAACVFLGLQFFSTEEPGNTCESLGAGCVFRFNFRGVSVALHF